MATVQSMNLMLPTSQPAQPSQPPDGSDTQSATRDFGQMVSDAHAQNRSTPSETAAPSKPTPETTRPQIQEAPVAVSSQGRIQHRGGLELVVGDSDVSTESLVEFMRSQGFSIGDAAQVLGLGQRLGKTPEMPTELTIGLPQKFQMGQGKVSLSQALLNQITAPVTSDDTFFIHEVVLPKYALGDWKSLLDQPARGQQQMMDFLDLIDDSLLAEASAADSLETALSHDDGQSGSFSQSPVARSGEGSSTTQSAQTTDFRSMISEFLRRSDSLQQLSDRMGQMMAARMAGQIGRGQWSLEMALHPAELGRIEIDMEMTERGLEAQFRTTQSVTRDLLLESMPRLKAWFEEGGINVASTLVDMGFQRHHGENPTERQEARAQRSDVIGDAADPLIDPETVLDGQNGLNILV